MNTDDSLRTLGHQVGAAADALAVFEPGQPLIAPFVVSFRALQGRIERAVGAAETGKVEAEEAKLENLRRHYDEEKSLLDAEIDEKRKLLAGFDDRVKEAQRELSATMDRHVETEKQKRHKKLEEDMVNARALAETAVLKKKSEDMQAHRADMEKLRRDDRDALARETQARMDAMEAMGDGLASMVENQKSALVSHGRQFNKAIEGCTDDVAALRNRVAADLEALQTNSTTTLSTIER